MRALLFLLAIFVATPVAAKPVRVTVTWQGDHFIAEYVFPENKAAWGFWRSSVAMADNRPFRPRSWTILTHGVKLERRGRHDALVGTEGRPVPRHVRVRVVPFTGHLVADYVPAMRLGDPGIALFDGHFAVFSIDSAAKLDSLPPNFDSTEVGDPGTAVTFQGSDLRIAGDVEGYRSGGSSGAYGLFGVPPAAVHDGVATVIDSDLPPWLAGYLTSYAPQVIASMTSGLGPTGVPEPTILASWEGAERGGASMNGGTLKGLILMRFEGRDALQPDDHLRRTARWFVAHEAAHFWLGQAVAYETPRDSWITEGGADLLAIRTVADVDPGYDAAARIDRAISDCARLGAKPVATANERGEHEAYYACGALFALVAERANGGDFFGFVRRLIETNQDDRRISRSEWLAELDRLSSGPELSRQIGAMIDQGAEQPPAAIATLLKLAGIGFTLDDKGVPRLR